MFAFTVVMQMSTSFYFMKLSNRWGLKPATWPKDGFSKCSFAVEKYTSIILCSLHF